MRKLLLFVFLPFFFILSAPAYSSDWLLVGDSAGGEKNYIDLASMRYENATVTFWAKNIDKKGEMTRTRFSLNCENGTAAMRDIIIYGSNETIVKSYSYKDEKLQWGKIPRYSFMNGFQKVLCKKRVME
jgi:hypothetical protein